MVDVFEAAYRVAHDFKGGAVALAARIGRNPGTLLNELNPACETAKLGIGEAQAITFATQDPRIAQAMLAPIGYTAVALPDYDKVGDTALLDLFITRDEQSGRFAEALSKALEDGRISADEFEAIEAAGMEAVGALLTLISRLKGMVR